MKRRIFLQSLSASALYSLIPTFAWAQNAVDEKLLVIKVDGGWDVSLFADPWIHENRPAETDFFLEYRQDQLLPFADSWVGPALEPLKPYFNRFSIINGILVNNNDNGHTASMVYMETGNGQGESAHIVTEAEHYNFKSAFGTASSETVYTGLQNRKVLNVFDIIRNREIQMPPENLSRISQQSQTELIEAISNLRDNRAQISRFNELLKKSGQNSLEESDVILALFQSGLSSTAVYEPSATGAGNIDSHSDHPVTHMTALKEAFQKTKDLFDKLQKIESQKTQGRSLLDETTVVIYSEFCRTPALNSSKGKDHNPQTNSVLVMGPRIRNVKVGGSRLIGRNDSKIGIPYLVGLPLQTNEQVALERQQASFFVRPETVLATVSESIGLDRSQLNEQVKNAKVLRSLLK